MGYKVPSPIQEKAIPVVLQGRDVIGSAQTGTGKTAAFALPTIARLKKCGKLRCLVLEPTRELAVQVDASFKEFTKDIQLRSTVIYGGVGYKTQLDALKKGTDIVIATPGRLLDLISQKELSLSDIEVLVLDEVDRMLDMGFLPDVRKIVKLCPADRQTLFFSATLPPEIEGLAKWVVKNPVVIAIGERRSPAETVSHAIYPVATGQKFDLLLALIEITNYKSVIVFTRTKSEADRISNRLNSLNHSVTVLHSDRSQRERTDALDGFKSGKYEILVATDIASRGLDVAGVSHVINYDIPMHPEDYVHRIGRTGRASAEGDAFTIVVADDLQSLTAIEKFIGQNIPRKKVDNFAYNFTALLDQVDRPTPVSKPKEGIQYGLSKKRRSK
ncbi:MAG: DEAD/DEAH box helicase [Verrucomicrobiota bacterium]|nr:DEAD/DEAH box helicase [Verrucomicrobiota bacterium]